jgi:SOS response regulatory protein OraA/RecX
MILQIRKKSDKDRLCQVIIDNSVWGTMSEKVLRTLFHYLPGEVDITDAEANLLSDELHKTAWNKLLDWLSKQEHSTSESKLYLKKHLFHKTIIEQCIADAKSRNYINDDRYCRLLIESLLIRKKSAFQIKGKLIEKRLPSALWEPILAELLNPHEQQDILVEQAQKVYLRYKHLDYRTCYTKCLSAMYRLGFDTDDAREAITDLLNHRQ